jgi:hypothetical protein
MPFQIVDVEVVQASRLEVTDAQTTRQLEQRERVVGVLYVDNPCVHPLDDASERDTIDVVKNDSQHDGRRTGRATRTPE